MSDLLTTVTKLSNAFGACGFEEEVTDLIADELHDLGELSRDKMKNLYFSRKENETALDDDLPLSTEGRRLRVMLDAHTDEVSFMVQAILPNGCLRILPLGSWLATNVPAHTMLIRTMNGKYIKGISSSRPPHFLAEGDRGNSVRMETIILDIGSSDPEETLRRGIRIGAPVVPDVQTAYDPENDLLLGKAFDCRSGCSAIIHSHYGWASLADHQHTVDLAVKLLEELNAEVYGRL